jgi:hypothetical protein
LAVSVENSKAKFSAKPEFGQSSQLLLVNKADACLAQDLRTEREIALVTKYYEFVCEEYVLHRED